MEVGPAISCCRASCIVILGLAACTSLFAATVEYDLTIARQGGKFTDRKASARTINIVIPCPVLRLSEGDLTRIFLRQPRCVQNEIGTILPPTGQLFDIVENGTLKKSPAKSGKPYRQSPVATNLPIHTTSPKATSYEVITVKGDRK